MSKFGKELIEAAREGLAYCKGEADASAYRVYTPPAEVDVKAIRKGLNMTQQVFGERFGFGPARIKDWEQRRTRPAASDRALLVTIKAAPMVVLHALEMERATVEFIKRNGIVTALEATAKAYAGDPAPAPVSKKATTRAAAVRKRPAVNA